MLTTNRNDRILFARSEMRHWNVTKSSQFIRWLIIVFDIIVLNSIRLDIEEGSENEFELRRISQGPHIFRVSPVRNLHALSDGNFFMNQPKRKKYSCCMVRSMFKANYVYVIKNKLKVSSFC